MSEEKGRVIQGPFKTEIYNGYVVIVDRNGFAVVDIILSKGFLEKRMADRIVLALNATLNFDDETLRKDNLVDIP